MIEYPPSTGLWKMTEIPLEDYTWRRNVSQDPTQKLFLVEYIKEVRVNSGVINIVTRKDLYFPMPVWAAYRFEESGLER